MEVPDCVVVVNIIILAVILSVCNANSSGVTRANRLVSYTVPEARELKKALGLGEDTYLNFTELTTKNGFPTEEHRITTDDGYILTTFRILPKCKENLKLYPILLVHGILDSSDTWIVAGEKLGLAYILARNCYDVWACNHRGNTYSRRHTKLKANKDYEFWNYSFDEHGNFDVPATIDYILEKTQKPKVFYAGHSMGTTDFFVMTSLRPEYNQKVQISIHLGPVAWMTNIISPVPLALAPNVREIKQLFDDTGFREILAKQQIIHFIIEILCHFATKAVCEAGLALTTGHEQGSIDPKILSIGFGHLFSGTSSKTLAHFGQLISYKKFRRFDEGTEGNVKRYNSRSPPDYNVSQITSPVVLISGQNDWLSTLKDLDILSAKLPNLIEHYVVPVPKWSHHNHLWDIRSLKLVMPKILDYLERYNV